jgi:LysR family transcriptional regulator, benzoate and cis,cis-muconate-responsive activator of ben and cat genes
MGIQVLECVDKMKALVVRLHDADRGPFRMGFVDSTLYGKLPEMIRCYQAARWRDLLAPVSRVVLHLGS